MPPTHTWPCCRTKLHLPFCHLSLTELLIGKKLRTDVPVLASRLVPNWTYLEDFRQSDEKFKRNQGLNYNHRHRVRALNDLPDGTEVWVRSGDSQTKGHIITPANTPRSYLVSTGESTIRRNRQHVIPVSHPEYHLETNTEPHMIMTRSRTGTGIRPPPKTSLYWRRGDVVLFMNMIDPDII